VRYRSIGHTGGIISAMSLSLHGEPSRRPTDWVNLIYAGLENGVSGFDVREPDLALAEGLRNAFAGVDRNLAFVAWRLGKQPASAGGGHDFSAKALTDQVRAALSQTGLQYLDVVMLDEPPDGAPTADAMAALEQLKAAGLIRYLGLAGESEAVDALVEAGAFDILQTPFNLTSGWRERHRLRAAGASDMSVIGYRWFPDSLRQVAEAQLQAKPASSRPLTACGTYAFLETTRGWRPEEICLAYALTEPALASVQVRVASPAEVERLAAVVDRDMPPGLSAQIEMARFSPDTARPEPPRAMRRA
jgi:aryl-alcohol dehydrogenase-like predicted oxidoreductase